METIINLLATFANQVRPVPEIEFALWVMETWGTDPETGRRDWYVDRCTFHGFDALWDRVRTGRATTFVVARTGDTTFELYEASARVPTVLCGALSYPERAMGEDEHGRPRFLRGPLRGATAEESASALRAAILSRARFARDLPMRVTPDDGHAWSATFWEPIPAQEERST